MRTHGRWFPLLSLAFAVAIGWLQPAVADHHGEQATGAAAHDAAGFKAIFDGQSLRGWDGDESFWRVEDGAIVGESTDENPLKTNTFLRWADGELDDFELTLRFRLSGHESANSGIQYRSAMQPDGHVKGYQADIDLAGRYLGANYDEHGRGMLAAPGEAKRYRSGGTSEPLDADAAKPSLNAGEWNDYRIVAQGGELSHFVNGALTSRVVDNDLTARDARGLLALQLHSGPAAKVEFKDIKLKRLPLSGDRKKVVFIGGTPSHGYGAHEFNAGSHLLADALNASLEQTLAVVYTNGWPTDPTALDNADAIVCGFNGGAKNPLLSHREQVDAALARGAGFVAWHYAVEVPVDDVPQMHKWLGGAFEPHYSVNPWWTPTDAQLAEHPIAQGVDSLSVRDEWYYHMRFVDGMGGVTPILSALPPRETLSRKDGPHSGNPAVREDVLEKQQPQHLAWTYDRPDGGRSFGFTGGHVHANWGDDAFRTLMLNAIVWTTGLDVPTLGVPSATPSAEQLAARQDFEPTEESEKRESEKKATAAEPERSIRDPEEAVAGLDTVDGLQTTLMASEPMLYSPSNIDVDDRGRVWVCEIVNYRHFRNKDNPVRESGDRILVLEDTDGDAVADRKTTFYQGTDIDSPHGVCVLSDRVIVSAGEHVFALFDDDGDLKADRKEVMFSGIDGVQHDHGIHSFLFGPDGKLYFNFGNEGKQLRDADGNLIVDRAGEEIVEDLKPYQMGMVFRCDLDGSNVETLGWNFRNNWETAIDSYGTLWQSDNDDDGNRGTRINFVMEYGNYGYRDELTGAGWREPRTGWEGTIPERHWHLNDPGVVPNLFQTGAGSPTGIMVYEGDLLPELYRGQIIHCDAGPNMVRAFPVQPDGAGYTATLEPMVTGERDRWFRPSDVTAAPDGSLIIADWYDPGVGGHAQGDVVRGRIFRLAPAGNDRYVSPRLDYDSVEGAIRALRNPNLAARERAWRALRGFGDEAIAALQKMTHDDDPRMAARALWCLGKMDGQGEAVIADAIDRDDANLRIVGLRLARQLDVAEPVLRKLATDPSAAVRREVCVALAEQSDEVAADVWPTLATQYDGADRWYLEALGIAARGRWSQCLDALESQVAVPVSETESVSAKQPAKSLGEKAYRDLVWRSRAARTPELLAKLIRAKSTPADELPRLLRSFDFQPSSDAKNDALADLAFGPPSRDDATEATMVRSEALDRLENVDFDANPSYRDALNAVLDSSRGSEGYLKLVKKFRLKERAEQLLADAVSQPETQFAGDAIAYLAKQKRYPLFRQMLGDDTRALPLIRAMRRSGSSQTTPPLMEIMNDQSRPLAVRRAAVDAMARSGWGAEELVKAVENGTMPVALQEAASAAMQSVSYGHLGDRIAKAFPAPDGKDGQSTPPIPELVQMHGDVNRGRLAFNSVGTCSKCHIVDSVGKEVGPNLSEIGDKLSREAMFESILYPSAGVSHNYETYLVLTGDGDVVTGLLVSETDDAITLRTVDAANKTIARDDIDALKKQDTSLMPAGLQKILSTQELVDVVDYMQTLRKKK